MGEKGGGEQWQGLPRLYLPSGYGSDLTTSTNEKSYEMRCRLQFVFHHLLTLLLCFILTRTFFHILYSVFLICYFDVARAFVICQVLKVLLTYLLNQDSKPGHCAHCTVQLLPVKLSLQGRVCRTTNYDMYSAWSLTDHFRSLGREPVSVVDLEIDRVERIDSTRLKIDRLDRSTRL